MSTLRRELSPRARRIRRKPAGRAAPVFAAPVFAALADPTRLALLGKLSGGSRFSISRLTQGSALTRQAITKHLRVLREAGLVRGIRQGRESLFELEPRRIQEARRALDNISRQWDQALATLKSFVEQ
jgi:DNA-binding transcriptional ArsR family regulator